LQIPHRTLRDTDCKHAPLAPSGPTAMASSGERPRPPLALSPALALTSTARHAATPRTVKSGELLTSSWTRRLDTYLAGYDQEGSTRGGGGGGGGSGGGSSRAPLGNIDDNRLRCVSRPPFLSHLLSHFLPSERELGTRPLTSLRLLPLYRGVSQSARDPATPSTFARGSARVTGGGDGDAAAKEDVLRRLNERLTSGLHFSSSSRTNALKGRGLHSFPSRST